MKKINKKVLVFVIVLFAGFIVNNLIACSVSVSEYALKNIDPSRYTLIYFHNKSISDSLMEKHNEFRQSIRGVNISFREINMADEKSHIYKEIIEKATNEKIPFYGLYYQRNLYTTYRDIEELNGLASSPKRIEIIKQLKTGAVCTILYLLSGDDEKDEKGLKTVKEAVKVSGEKGVTIMELLRDNPDEQPFINLLLNIEPNLEGHKEPMVFPVFGKFIVLEPLIGADITLGYMKYLFDFLNADCSCIIKGQMPGVNMIHIYDWDFNYEGEE